MLTIRQAIAVEGRYDQNKLAQLVDALIVPLDGFGIFRDQGKLQYLRRLAREYDVQLLEPLPASPAPAAGAERTTHTAGELTPLFDVLKRKL